MRNITLRQTSNGFMAECPSLLGCTSYGRTRSEAVHNMRHAIVRYERAGRDIGLIPHRRSTCSWVHRPSAVRSRVGW